MKARIAALAFILSACAHRDAPPSAKPTVLFFHQKNCPFSKRMEDERSRDPAFDIWIRDHFAVREIEGSVGHEQEIARRDVHETPTFVFLRPDGTEFDRFTGYRDPRAFREFLESARRQEDAVAKLAARRDAAPNDNEWSSLTVELWNHLLGRGEDARVREEAERLALRPSHGFSETRARMTLARIAGRNGDPTTMERALVRALEAATSDDEAREPLQSLGDWYLRTGRREKLLDLFDEHSRRLPTRESRSRFILEAARQKRRMLEALRSAETLLKEVGQADAFALTSLAEIRLARGERREAKKILSRLDRLSPVSAAETQAREELRRRILYRED